jgi:dihydroorotase
MSTSPDTLTLTRPDDWHLHVRDGEPLHTVVPHTAAQFGRAIIMPNLKPPVTTAEQALAYKARIQAAVPAGMSFEPLMTLYLTDKLPPAEIKRAKAAGVVAAKLYPAGATTNSDAGVTDLRKIYKTLEAMQREGMLLLVHGEVTSADIDLFDREAVFIEQHLIPLRRDFPELKIVFEHITTREAAHYVRDADRFVGATITAHHLLYNRNAIFTGGAHLKEHASGCAGCYTAYAAIEMYAEAFDNAGALHQLEAFASFNGADFYGLPRNTSTITLKREAWTPPASFAFGNAELKPLRAGEALPWRMV